MGRTRGCSSGQHDEAFYGGLWGTLARGETWSGSLVNRRKDGTLFDVQQTIAAVRDASGTTTNYISVTRDITEQKRAGEKLAATSRDLKARNAELDAFVFSISHDLKTPVVTIQGYASALAEDCADILSDDAKRYLQYLQSAAAKMGSLIRSLLDLSKVERADILRTDVNVLEVVAEVVDRYGTQFAQRGVDIRIGSEFPLVRADRERLEQVFDNLVGNALKFSKQGRETRIEIGYTRRELEHCFFVRDNGIGIEPEHCEQIFELFYRLKEIEDPEGTGIGLAMVKRIVERHGGRVWAESRYGEGSTFYFTLPQDGASAS